MISFNIYYIILKAAVNFIENRNIILEKLVSSCLINILIALHVSICLNSAAE